MNCVDHRGRELAEFVRVHRSEMGLSIEKVAKAAGISPVTWRRVERGQKSYEPTLRILEAYFASVMDDEEEIAALSALVHGPVVAAKKKPFLDAELEALTTITDALLPLDPRTRARVIRWVTGRIGGAP